MSSTDIMTMDADGLLARDVNAVAVAACLTDAQKRGILALPADGAWVRRYYSRPNTVEVLFHRYGLLEARWAEDRAILEWRLSTLGRWVRSVLERQADA